MRQLLQLLFFMLSSAVWASDADTLTTVCYDFNEPLGNEWTYIHEPVSENYRIHDGMLRIFASVTSLKDDVQPTFVGLRPESEDYSMTMKIAQTDFLDSDEVGLAVYQAPMGYVQCYIYNLRGDRRMRVRLVLKNITTLMSDRSIGNTMPVWIRLDASSGMYRFSYSTNGQRYVALESVDQSLLRPVVVGQGDGIQVGPYAYMGSPKSQSGHSFGDIEELEITFPKKD